jgi:hypothetical protein
MKEPNIIYYDSTSIAVINMKSKLRRIYCPFMVWCIESIGDIQENSCVYVDEVFKAPNNLLCYKIGGSVYPYSNFRISINF